MADEGIKKVIINNEDLPAIQFDTTYNNLLERLEVSSLHYDFRYRIVSEDKNRYSHWSPIIRYSMPDITTPFPYTTSNRFAISKPTGTDVISAVWSKPGALDAQTEYEKIYNKITTYDVWLRWNENNVTDLNDAGWTAWQYQTTTTANNFSILKRDSAVKRVEIAIQASTGIKLRDYNNNKLTLYRGLSGTI